MSVPVEKRQYALNNSGVLAAASDKRLYVLRRGDDPSRADDVDGSDPTELEAFLDGETLIDVYFTPDLQGDPATRDVSNNYVPLESESGQYFWVDGSDSGLYWHEGGQVEYYCPDDPVRPLQPTGIGLQDTTGWINVDDCRGEGRDDDEAVDLALTRAALIGQDIYFGPTPDPYQLTGDHIMLSGVSIHGSGYAGRIERTGAFTKASRSRFFTSDSDSLLPIDDVTIENVYVDGKEEEIELATGVLDGPVTFGTSDTHTDGQAAGVVKLRSCTGSFGVPDVVAGPGFGVAILDNKVIHYLGVTNNGTANITLTGCTGSSGTADDGDIAGEHPGNQRMPAFAFQTGGTGVKFLNNVTVNFPGQGFQATGLETETGIFADFKVTGNYSFGHRGYVFRRSCLRGQITGNSITSTDDCIALLAGTASAPTQTLVSGNIVLSQVSTLQDSDDSPEYAGNGIATYGIVDAEIAGNIVLGSGTTSATGNDKSGIKVSGGDSNRWYPTNVRVHNNLVVDANGHGIRVGGLGSNPFNGQDIFVTANSVINANQQGIYLATKTATDRIVNVWITDNDLVDCGINNGAYDQAAIRTASTAGAVWIGLHIDDNRIIRPGRHALLTDSDLSVLGGTFVGNTINDPNQGNTASTPAVVLNGITKGKVHNNDIWATSGRAFAVLASSDVFTAPGHRLADTDQMRLLSATGSAGVSAGSAYFVRDTTTVTKSFTVTAADDTFTSTSHGFVNGNPVELGPSLSGASPLTIRTTYYVRDVTANTFKLAESSGGTAIGIEADGSGELWANTFKLALTSGGAAINITSDGTGVLSSTVSNGININNTCTKIGRIADSYIDPDVFITTAISDSSTSAVTLV